MGVAAAGRRWPTAPVLIVGYGAVGAAVEARLAGFECTVLRVARRAREGVAAMSALAELLPRADVVVLTVPMTDETVGLVDAAFLAAMPDGALLVNVARGPVVVTDALLAELETGRLLAALDVTDPEPLPAGAPAVVGARPAAQPARRRQHLGVPAAGPAAGGRAGAALWRRGDPAQRDQRSLLTRLPARESTTFSMLTDGSQGVQALRTVRKAGRAERTWTVKAEPARRKVRA